MIVKGDYRSLIRPQRGGTLWLWRAQVAGKC
jgi:hypothetical protein